MAAGLAISVLTQSVTIWTNGSCSDELSEKHENKTAALSDQKADEPKNDAFSYCMRFNFGDGDTFPKRDSELMTELKQLFQTGL